MSVSPEVMRVDTRLAVRTACLVNPKCRNDIYDAHHFLSGFCYVASETYYSILGRWEGLKPARLMHDDIAHWYLRGPNTGNIMDVTGDQFATTPDYDTGKGCGFLTKNPSKKAQILIKSALEFIPPDTLIALKEVNEVGLQYPFLTEDC